MLVQLVNRWTVDFGWLARQDHVSCDGRRGRLPRQGLDAVDVCLKARLHRIDKLVRHLVALLQSSFPLTTLMKDIALVSRMVRNCELLLGCCHLLNVVGGQLLLSWV